MIQELLVLPLLLAPLQEGGAPEETGAPPADQASAEALKNRIHEMRMNLLLGGDRVRQAEREAIDFYTQKTELVERRLDTVQVELSEKRASYDVALGRALAAGDAEARRKALQEAGVLKTELSALDAESRDLGEKRSNLTKLVNQVQGRERDRERLVTQLETSSSFDPALGFPVGGIGLAPALPQPAAATTLEDDALVADLLERDPAAARRLIFAEDPQGYWERFPLQPPRKALHAALEFPLPDLPGRR